MEDTMIAHLLSNVGIPAALCFYTLFNVNKNLEKLADALNNCTGLLDRRLTALEHDIKELKRSG